MEKNIQSDSKSVAVKNSSLYIQTKFKSLPKLFTSGFNFFKPPKSAVCPAHRGVSGQGLDNW